ncbi:hypothetical protein N8977_00190 [Alphaproteobacteria bacterium]|nr:hypothetical protein [Alphaproteobacteria bacterium]
MRKQLELFESPFIKFHKDTEEMSRLTAKALDDNFGDLISNINHHEPIIQLEEAKTEAMLEHDDDRYDELCILQCDIEVAAESGDRDRLIELVQMKTAYIQ